MKRSVEALVAIATLAVATSAAHAVSPVVRIEANGSLTRYSTGGDVESGARFRVTTTFSTDTPGAPLLTIQKAVIYFPDREGTNGRLFPSCSAAQIERFHGNVGRCPKGSKIGGGRVTAEVAQLGLTATGKVALFNGPRGKSVTMNIQATNPAYINESLEAPLVRVHSGRYREKLTLVVPHSLQEILSGVFVGVRTFEVTLGGVVRVDGVDYSFLRERRCPTLPVHAIFDFKDWTTGANATTTADAKIHCTAG